MYLFTRAARLASGHLVESMDWSARMTEKVNALSEVEVSLWTTVFSPGLLTLSWTAVVENLSQMTTLNDKTLADSGYVELADEGAKYSSGEAIDDSLVRFVHADPDGASTTTQFASVVQAVLAPGHAVTGIGHPTLKGRRVVNGEVELPARWVIRRRGRDLRHRTIVRRGPRRAGRVQAILRWSVWLLAPARYAPDAFASRSAAKSASAASASLACWTSSTES